MHASPPQGYYAPCDEPLRYLDRRDTDRACCSDDLRELEGAYYSEELAAAYTVELRDGKLVARHLRHREIELSPVVWDEFSGSVWFATSIEFVRKPGGAAAGLMISNGRALNVRFTTVR